jgi:hypothetical protein
MAARVELSPPTTDIVPLALVTKPVWLVPSINSRANVNALMPVNWDPITHDLDESVPLQAWRTELGGSLPRRVRRSNSVLGERCQQISLRHLTTEWLVYV